MPIIVIAQGDRFRIEAEQQKDVLIIRPVGEIDEDANLRIVPQAIGQFPQMKVLLFDLGKITKINSCGVREWVLFLEWVTSHGPYGFVMLNELTLHQISMFPGLLGKPKAGILAFEAPYYCSRCQSRVLKTIKTKELSFPNPRAPQFTCETCKNPLELDALESEYLRFLKTLEPQS